MKNKKFLTAIIVTALVCVLVFGSVVISNYIGAAEKAKNVTALSISEELPGSKHFHGYGFLSFGETYSNTYFGDFEYVTNLSGTVKITRNGKDVQTYSFSTCAYTSMITGFTHVGIVTINGTQIHTRWQPGSY